MTDSTSRPRPNTSWRLTVRDVAGLAALVLPTTDQSFWSRVDGDGGDDAACHLWTGEIGRDGFGRFRVQGQRFLANRAALYLYTRRPLIEGMAVSPTCGTPACVNGRHLKEQWPVESTAASIGRRRHRTAKLKARAECPHGHAWDDTNTEIEADGSRRCLECRREYDRRRGPAKRAHIKQDPEAHERQKEYDRASKARLRATDPERLRAANRRWYARNRQGVALSIAS